MRVFEDSRALLARMGHRHVDWKAPFDGQAVNAAFLTVWSAGAGYELQDLAKRLGRPIADGDVEPLTLSWASRTAKLTRPQFDAAAATLETMAGQYAAQFDGFDVLMTPTLALPPVRIGQLAPTQNFDALEPLLLRYVAYTPLENAAGAPSISLPMGFSSDGLPIGIQFTTRPGGERVLIELAYALENELAWHRRYPPAWVG